MILACPFCKAKADPAAARCGGCGKTMSRACPACAETVAANTSTCKYCGEGMAPAAEPAPVKSHPGIVFLEDAPRKKRCCGGRTMLWVIAGILAGFCAVAMMRSKVNCHRAAPVKQTIEAPAGRDF